jgi:hypothetical protein
MLRLFLMLSAWVAAGSLEAASVWVEAEAFDDCGGWVVDPQFVEQMGSPYLMAHGLGVPVAPARTTVRIAQGGTYRVWVRTRDWAPDHPDAPGQFQVQVGETLLPTRFGTAPPQWGWQDGGTVELAAGDLPLALHDLTGFNARCDAIVLAADPAFVPPDGGEALAALRARLLGEPPTPGRQESFELVVVGGGMAGCSAAVAAARQGLRVVLIHDRPVFGGNASGEIRVRTEGIVRHAIVESLRNPVRNTRDEAVQHDLVRAQVLEAEPTLTLLNPWRAYGVVMQDARIEAVDARHIATGERIRCAAPLFIDCTGDGWIGYWAGAEFRMGREAASEFGESRAPETADGRTLGSSLMWTTVEAATPSPFPEVPWATAVAGSDQAVGGEWDWEYGIERNTIHDAEAIRDHLLRAIFGNFANAKRQPEHARHVLHWVPYIAGKRESRRLLGDHVLTEHDIRGGGDFEDAVAWGSWTIDLHEPTAPGHYRARAIHTRVEPYGIPFRSLYSRNIENLLMAGRCFSASHVGLGSPRVMHTGGQMGVATGYAAALCLQYDVTPRQLAQDPGHIRELQSLIQQGALP